MEQSKWIDELFNAKVKQRTIEPRARRQEKKKLPDNWAVCLRALFDIGVCVRLDTAHNYKTSTVLLQPIDENRLRAFLRACDFIRYFLGINHY